MEYFGLKDKDGKDVKLVVTDDSFVHPHPIIRVESIEPVRETYKSEFKVGDWICDKRDSSFLKRITTLQDDAFCADGIDNALYLNLDRDWRHATPQEIEAHLRKICDEKYVGKVIKSIYQSIGVVLHFDKYLFDTDEMIYRENHCSTFTVYKQGKFAKIVPGESKELPNTVEELKELIYKFKYTCGNNCSIGEFLRKQGYKTA